MDFITYSLVAAAGAAGTFYIPVPYRCVILSASVAANYEAGADTVVQLTNGSTEQATVTLASTSEAAVTAMTISATTIFEAGTAIKVDCTDDAGSATGVINITIVIDPFLAGVAGT